MKAHDEVRTSTLRLLSSAFNYEKIEKQHDLTGEEELNVIRKQAKQRKDSIEQFKAGGREDLVETEEKELEIIKKYLPEEVSEEKIRKVAEKKKEEMGVTDKSKMGILVGAVMKELKGQADGSVVKKLVEKALG